MKSKHLLAAAGALVIGLSLPLAAMAQQGAAPANPAPAAPAKTTSTSSAHHSSSKHPAIDLNAASKDDLMKLPGVTDETADKIIAARPFKSKNELVSKKLMTETEYKKISSHVTVKTQKAASASTGK